MNLTMMGLRLLLELFLPILCDLSKSLIDNSLSKCSFITVKTILSAFSCSYFLTPCTSKQFLREYCSLSSDFLSNKSIFSFKELNSLCNPFIIFSYSFRCSRKLRPREIKTSKSWFPGKF